MTFYISKNKQEMSAATHDRGVEALEVELY